MQILKVLVAGDIASGKSAFLASIIGVFTEEHDFMPTLEVTYLRKQLTADITLLIVSPTQWEVGGHPMFAEIEQQYYASIDLVFLFYHGIDESVAEVPAKAQKIAEIRPQALICLLRNGDIGEKEALLSSDHIERFEFDPANTMRSREILTIAVNRCLQIRQNTYKNERNEEKQIKSCSLL